MEKNGEEGVVRINAQDEGQIAEVKVEVQLIVERTVLPTLFVMRRK